MKIGVIGIGEMGGALARRWSEKGHSVRVANSHGSETVKHFADEIGADAADIYAPGGRGQEQYSLHQRRIFGSELISA